MFMRLEKCGKFSMKVVISIIVLVLLIIWFFIVLIIYNEIEVFILLVVKLVGK